MTQILCLICANLGVEMRFVPSQDSYYKCILCDFLSWLGVLCTNSICPQKCKKSLLKWQYRPTNSHSEHHVNNKMTPELDRYGRKAWNMSYKTIFILINHLLYLSLQERLWKSSALHVCAHMDFSIWCHQLLSMEVFWKKVSQSDVT